MNKLISSGSEWTFGLIEEYDRQIATIAADFKLDTYPNQIEVISSEQMMDAYASSGMPLGYSHWSYGKQFINVEQSYRRGHMGLAYEIVINSSPCIAYLMEENTMTMQALVIAHACYGHNSFFKGNYLFRTWTDAESIIDYLLFSKNYIAKCEQRYGVAEVEKIIDSCHALMNYGVDRYKRPYPISATEEVQRQEEREIQLQQQVNDLWRTIPDNGNNSLSNQEANFPAEPEENILYFIEKHAPLLEPWQREVIRIIRKTAQYFYPQRQTQLMNEGWATYWHYTLLNEMYDRRLVDDGFMMEFLQSHSGVVYQPSFDSGHYSGINPYALGFSMMRDIRRICENPTQEDRYWFPEFAGRDWLETLHLAMRDFKDESFVMQYLSPKMMRDFKLFSIVDDDQDSEIEVDAIHDESGYRTVRENLSNQYNLQSREPNIQVHSVDMRGDRSICLHHVRDNRRPLEQKSAQEVLKHVHRLWGFPAKLLSFEAQDNRVCPIPQQSFYCPSPAAPAEPAA